MVVTGLRSFLLSLLWLLVFLAVMGFVWRYLLPYVLPFALALFLAVLIDPFVNALEGWRLPRGVAVGVVLLVAAGALGLGVFTLVSFLRFELTLLVQSLPEYYTRGLELIQRAQAGWGSYYQRIDPGVWKALGADWQSVYSSLSAWVGATATSVGALRAVPGVIATVVITVVATFFISRDRRLIGRFLLSMLPGAFRSRVLMAKGEVFNATMGFVKAQLTLMILTGLVTVIGLNFIGVPYAFSLGVLTGLLDLLPVLGPGLVFLPWIAYHVLFGDRALGLWVAVLYGGTAAVRQAVEPKLVGDRIGVHPLATLIALYIGLQVFGAGGVILGPLTVVLLKAFVRSGLLPIFRYGEDDA